MKILLPVISYYYLTGAELYVFELASELIRRGHEVTVVAMRIGGALGTVKRCRYSCLRVWGPTRGWKLRYDPRFRANSDELGAIRPSVRSVDLHDPFTVSVRAAGYQSTDFTLRLYPPRGSAESSQYRSYSGSEDEHYI